MLFLRPGMVFRLRDGDFIVVDYIWSHACDCIDKNNQVRMYPHSALRNPKIATHIGNNYKVRAPHG